MPMFKKSGSNVDYCCNHCFKTHIHINILYKRILARHSEALHKWLCGTLTPPASLEGHCKSSSLSWTNTLTSRPSAIHSLFPNPCFTSSVSTVLCCEHYPPTMLHFRSQEAVVQCTVLQRLSIITRTTQHWGMSPISANTVWQNCGPHIRTEQASGSATCSVTSSHFISEKLRFSGQLNSGDFCGNRRLTEGSTLKAKSYTNIKSLILNVYGYGEKQHVFRSADWRCGGWSSGTSVRSCVQTPERTASNSSSGRDGELLSGLPS